MRQKKEEETRERVGFTESGNYICVEDLQSTQELPSFNPVNLDYAGSENCEPGHSFGPYIRTNFVLHMVTSGRGTLLKKDRTWTIGRNQAFLIFPGENVTYQADSREPWSYMWVGFHGFRAETMMLHAGFTKSSPVVPLGNMDRIREVMNDLLATRDLGSVGELYRTSDLYRLFALLTEYYEQGRKEDGADAASSDYQYVRRAAHILMDSYRTNVRIEDVAKQIGISRNYLSSIFKRETGVSPQEYLISFRMEKAALLLRYSSDPVSVVAIEVGYSDPLSFSKAFKRKWGMSPSEYRTKKPELVSGSMKGDYTGDYPL